MASKSSPTRFLVRYSRPLLGIQAAGRVDRVELDNLAVSGHSHPHLAWKRLPHRRRWRTIAVVDDRPREDCCSAPTVVKHGGPARAGHVRTSRMIGFHTVTKSVRRISTIVMEGPGCMNLRRESQKMHLVSFHLMREKSDTCRSQRNRQRLKLGPTSCSRNKAWDQRHRRVV